MDSITPDMTARELIENAFSRINGLGAKEAINVESVPGNEIRDLNAMLDRWGNYVLHRDGRTGGYVLGGLPDGKIVPLTPSGEIILIGRDRC